MSKSAKRNFIIAVILIALSLGAFALMVYQINAQGAELETQLIALEEERAQEASFLRLQRIAEESIADREQVRSYFLEQESDSIDFLNLIEAIAPEAGVVLATDALGLIVDPSDQSQWIEATFSFSGSREEVERFIRILESVPYVSRVTSIEMNARSSTEWRASVIIQVRVLAYDE